MIRALKIIAQGVDVSKDDLTNLPKADLTGGSGGTISNALRLVFAIAGAVAVLIVMLGAFQYIVSQGEPQATAKAKNTIMYAVIGLVVCMLAFTIVTYVVDNL